MAYTKKEKDTTSTKNKTVDESVKVDTEEIVKEETTIVNKVNEVTEVPTVKKYDKEDVIPCKSITNGKLLVTGEKSGLLYRWANYGDVEEIEYQDLIYMIRSKSRSVFKPRFIIQDKDFVEQHRELKELYNSLYSIKDLKDILNLPIPQMISAIKELPEGVFESLKGVVASMITSGQFDSVKKIKVLDEIFDTKLLLTLTQQQ